jgi:hypothetical protein
MRFNDGPLDRETIRPAQRLTLAGRFHRLIAFARTSEESEV